MEPTQPEKILSKNQIKKLAKQQKWAEEKHIRKALKKQKDSLKKLLLRQNAEVKEEKLAEPTEFRTKRKDDYKNKMRESMIVVIDLQFYDLMVEKEKKSLIKQLGYCHALNRKEEKCFNLVFSSVTHSRHKELSEQYNADKWGISMTENNVLEHFDKKRLVYLTGDAEDEIEEFEPECVYIIGGIVDHNRLKNITIDFAKKYEIKAQRLPMEGVKLKASMHLAVNHVFEWMLKKYNGSTWEQAIKSVIPLRKREEE